MTDFIITLTNCSFWGYHGVLDFEQENGQPFIVDATLTVTGTTGLLSDQVEETVDYSKVYGHVETIVTQRRFDLIERLAHEIATSVCSAFEAVARAEITVKKPQAPIDGDFDHVAVTVVHER